MFLDLGSTSDLPLLVLSVVLGVVLVLDTIPVLGVLVPADLVVLAAVGTRSASGSTALVLAVVSGTLIGWTGTFVVGRFLAGPLRRSWLGRRIGDRRWADAERLVAEHGGRIVLAAPFLPVFNTIVPLVAGSLRMPYLKFVAHAAVGSALWAGGYVTLGLVAQQVGGAVSGTPSTSATVLFGLPGLSIGWFVLSRVRRRMPSTMEVDAAQARSRTTTAAHANQPSAASRAMRSSTPLTYPRPTRSMARPTAASRGTVRPAPSRLIRRSRSSASGAAAISIIATAARARAPALATAWTRSATLGLSYGGSGQPRVQDTVPEVAVRGAAAARASAAAGTSGRTATASSARAAARAKMPTRYTSRSGAPGAPASLTYP